MKIQPIKPIYKPAEPGPRPPRKPAKPTKPKEKKWAPPVYPILKATVRWFDKSSGEGMIRTEDGQCGFINAAGIPGRRTWFPHTACVLYKADQSIDVFYDEGINMWCPVTKGHFDEEKWNSLDQSRLAFKCDDNGDAINGLFSRGDK